MKPWKLCKRKGFTFVETMFVLAIIGIVAGISLPVVVEAVKDLDTQSLLDSAVYSLRQFFVDVRSASIMNPKVYCFNNDSSKQLSFSVGEETAFRYTLPEGLVQEASLEVEAKKEDNDKFCYVMGYFMVEQPNFFKFPDLEKREFQVKLLLGETVAATVSIVNGLPVVEVLP